MWRFLIIGSLFISACASSPNRSARQGIFQNTTSTTSESLSCGPLTETDRDRILKFADPENFQHTRYHKGPRFGAHNIEKEADCSSFVHEIYYRAGLNFAYRSSRQLAEADEFDRLPISVAKPGDIMVFSGHVGIVAADGEIISATRVHRRNPKRSAITKMSKDNFHGRPYILRYRCGTESMARR